MDTSNPGSSDSATVTLNITPVNDAPAALDDTYTTPQGTPLSTVDPVSGTVTTTFADNNGQGGNMFDVTAGSGTIFITGFDLHIRATGSREVAVYYKPGTYAGSEQTPGDWNLLGAQFVNAQGMDNPTFMDLTPIGGLTIPAGQTYGLYVTVTDTNIQLNYTNGANTYSNGNLTITTGTGNTYPFGNVFFPRTWNGTIYYDVNPDVLRNDLDVDGDSLTASLSTGPANGALTFNGDGTFIYTPTISFVGVDTFDYIASDSILTDTATVSITVAALPCLVETTGDNLTDYASADESALQNAVNNANPGDLLKVGGTCAGVQTFSTITQTVYITQSLTIQGGYTYTNWLATPDPVTNPTVLDALGTGRVVYIPSGSDVAIQYVTLTNGNGFNGGGGNTFAGGIWLNSGSTLDLLGVTVTGSTSSRGGGIMANGTLTMTDSLVTNNSSTSWAGGIMNGGQVTVWNSNISNNSGEGAGLFNDGGNTLIVANSTISGNQPATNGGGIQNRGLLIVTNSTISGNADDGVINYFGNVTALIRFSTIVSNTGNGIQNNNSGGVGIVNLSNTIVAYNGSPDCVNFAVFNDNGYNLMQGAGISACDLVDGVNGNIIGADPLLGPLADNGGGTQTHGLLSGSPAIDAGDNTTCEPTDQRGVARPVDATCDIGAVELDTNFVPVAASDAYATAEETPLNIVASGVLTNDVDGDWDPITAVLDTTASNGALTLNSDGSFGYNPDENFCGADGFTYHADDESASSNVVTVTLTITCVNDDPVADDDTFIVSANTSDNPLNVLDGDTDVDGDPLTISAFSTPDQGGTLVSGSTVLTYTPTVDFIGIEVFTYTVSDGNGGLDTAAVTLTVTTAPIVDAGIDQTADEGASVSFSGIYTLYPIEAVNLSWDFGDGATATGTLTPTHTYSDNGTFTVTLTVTGTYGVGTDTLIVTVLNVDPILAPLPDQSVETDEVISFSVVYSDPGTLDTHTATVDWGDGTVEAGTVNAIAGTVSGSHAYTSPGEFIVTVTLSDDDGGMALQTFTVTVTEPAPGGYQLFLPILTK